MKVRILGRRCGPPAQTQDTVGGIYDFLYRNYSPVHGRWLTPDPAGLNAVDPTNPQSWNRYAYVLNSPLNATDPLGLECVWDDGSYDAPDDPDTGSEGGCNAAGGTYVDHKFFERIGAPDWSSNPNSFLAQYAPLLAQGSCGSGLSAGYSLGGTFEAGNGMERDGAVMAIANGSAGGGLFWDSNKPLFLSAGGFASGALAGSGGLGKPLATPKQDLTPPSSVGLFTGGGASIWLSNAASVNKIADHFAVLSMNVGFGARVLQIQYAKSGDTWQLTLGIPAPITPGGGVGMSISTFTSNTKVLGMPGDCQ